MFWLNFMCFNAVCDILVFNQNGVQRRAPKVENRVFQKCAISLDRVQLLQFRRPKTTPTSEELELGLMK